MVSRNICVRTEEVNSVMAFLYFRFSHDCTSDFHQKIYSVFFILSISSYFCSRWWLVHLLMTASHVCHAVELEILQFLDDKLLIWKYWTHTLQWYNYFLCLKQFILLSSALVKIIFFVNIINYPKRNLLNDSKFEKLVFLKVNYNYIIFSAYNDCFTY